VKNFITRWFRRRKKRQLNKFLIEHGFIMEYMKSVDRYCGSFVDHHTRYGDLINSHIFWFEGNMSVHEIKDIVKEREAKKLYYEEPIFYKKEQ